VIPLATARQFVLDGCAPLVPRQIPLDEALGCVSSEAIVAHEAVPAFANTAMDGYAVRAADNRGSPGAAGGGWHRGCRDRPIGGTRRWSGHAHHDGRAHPARL